jgi:hypothetical protein
MTIRHSRASIEGNLALRHYRATTTRQYTAQDKTPVMTGVYENPGKRRQPLSGSEDGEDRIVPRLFLKLLPRKRFVTKVAFSQAVAFLWTLAFVCGCLGLFGVIWHWVQHTFSTP